MPNYAIYDPASSPVTGLLTQYLPSFPQEKEGTLPATRVRDPDMTGISPNSARWNGSAIVALTAPEIAAIATARSVARLTGEKASLKERLTNVRTSERALVESLAEVFRVQLNALRAAVLPTPLAPLTRAQVRTAIIAEYDSQVDSLP